MKFLMNFLFIASLLLTYSVDIIAEEGVEEAPEKSNVIRGGKALTEEELSKSIGRYGEVDEIPEDFEFATAENILWLDNHLGNITQPTSLYYEFIKSGTYEEGFSDSVYLKIVELNEDGTKNTLLDFFTAERKQTIPEGNTTHIRGNPVLGIYMNGDVYDMARITGGGGNRYRYFLKKIKVDLVYFTGPSQYSLYLEDTDFIITVPDVSHREEVEFPEWAKSAEFERSSSDGLRTSPPPRESSICISLATISVV